MITNNMVKWINISIIESDIFKPNLDSFYAELNKDGLF